MTGFRLSDSFVEKYIRRRPSFGPIGYVTYKSKYARPVEGENRTEEWWETIRRVVEGCYTIQKEHCETLRLPWHHNKAQKSAQEMYNLMWEMKFLPPGRGLWMMGTSFVNTKGSAALNSCAFVSTKEINVDFAEPFCFLMDMSMLGVGVGGDTKGAGLVKVKQPRDGNYTFTVEDSREGWVELVRTILNAFVWRGSLPEGIDYSKVRPLGEPIKTFGGTACLTGDTVIYKDRKKSKEQNELTISDLYQIKHGTGFWAHKPNHFRDIKIRSLDEKTGEFFRNQVVDIIYNGTAPVYQIKTHLGYQINATSIHRFMAEDGHYQQLQYFKPGQLIAVNGSKERKTGVCIDCNTPITRRAIRCRSCTNKAQCKASCSDTSARQRKECRKYLGSSCEYCEASNTRLLVHHKDEDPKNNISSNLETLCEHCHHIHHAKKRSLSNPYQHKYISYDEITSIEYLRDDLVFDLEMQGPNHNFIANGFISHNSGPAPLKQLVQDIKDILTPLIDETITSEAITDIFNTIGKCVVSGNVRRSAEIMLGDPEDEVFLGLKDKSKSKKHARLCSDKGWRWAGNNSVFAKIGMDYSKPIEYTKKNGEIGYFWLETARRFGRLIDPPNDADTLAEGCNPCGEQTLESYELCCLVESFPARHETYSEYERTLKFAYLYAKTVTLVPTHNARTNAVMLRNRRIGTSQSGITQSLHRQGVREHFRWCDKGYKFLRSLDSIYSRWLCVPNSLKITSVKPSGTISLLPGATPGVHFPIAEYYWRCQRHTDGSSFVKAFRDAGYRIEEGEGHNTVVIYFPVKEKNYWKCRSDITIWEQLEIAAQMQAYWSDNQVSVTITFKPEEADQIELALQLYEDKLKAVSFLPLKTTKEMKEMGYEHPPYQALTKEEYEQAIAGLKPIKLRKIAETQGFEKSFCDSENCTLAE